MGVSVEEFEADLNDESVQDLESDGRIRRWRAQQIFVAGARLKSVILERMDGLQRAQKACCITERSRNEYSPFIN
jgi:hypothetical protein